MNENKEEIKYLTVQGTSLMMTLYKDISDIIDCPEKTNQSCSDRAHKYLLSLKKEECEEVLKKANQLVVTVKEFSDIPKTIKVRILNSDFEKLSNIYKKTFDLTRMRMSHYSQTILKAYYLHLLEERKKLGIRSREDVNNEQREANTFSNARYGIIFLETLEKNDEVDKSFVEYAKKYLNSKI